MSFTINPADPRPVYVQVRDEIRRAITLGILGPNEPLPSLRQLATDLGLNPNTVAQAYRELERAGVVYVRRGQGTFVSAQGSASETERQAMASAVAERALIDAHRHGLRVNELLDAIRAAAGARDAKARDASARDAE